MSAKFLAPFAAALFLTVPCCMAGAASAPPPPLLLLFPHDSTNTADLQAMIALRTQLRHDGKVQVISFEPNAPSIILAATNAGHPEWLTGLVSTDDTRIAIARAVGAAYTATVFHADHNNAAVSLYQVGDTPQAWSLTSGPIRQAAAVLERDVALSTPKPASPTVPKPTASQPAVPTIPKPAAPTITPPPMTPAPPILIPPPNAPAPAPVPAIAPQPAVPAPITPAPTGQNTATPRPAGETAESVAQSSRAAADLSSVQPLISKADADVASGNLVQAYALYNAAINDAPLSDVPRLKLAEAYLQGGLPDMALSEARRALEVAPNSAGVQEFLARYDTLNGTTAGKVARYQAIVEKNPQDASAHLDLAGAFWSEGDDKSAIAEYQKARDLAPNDSLDHQKALAHLAALETATGNFTQALLDEQASGDLGYPLVISVIQNSADNMTADMDNAQDSYDSGKMTRADFYGKVQADETQSQALADFISKIKPPPAYAQSHLDRVEAVSLLSQSAAVLADYLETDDSARHDKALQLEKDAQAEMLTAHAAEEKLGLWNEETRVGEENH